jgi:Sortase domain
VSPTTAAEKRMGRARNWLILATALIIAGTGCAVFGLRETAHPLPGPVAAHAAIPAPVASAVQKAATLQAPRSVPMGLHIAALDLSVPLSSLGLNPDGTVQVPTDVQEPGWFRLGPTPGQIGSAVILGHVDSAQGPGVFFGLRTLVPGDQVVVDLASGATVTFDVTSVAMYTKEDFPDQTVYGSNGSSALHLVTCGGIFDQQTGHYLSNIVVSTSLVGVVPAPLPVVNGLRQN